MLGRGLGGPVDWITPLYQLRCVVLESSCKVREGSSSPPNRWPGISSGRCDCCESSCGAYARSSSLWSSCASLPSLYACFVLAPVGCTDPSPRRSFLITRYRIIDNRTTIATPRITPTLIPALPPTLKPEEPGLAVTSDEGTVVTAAGAAPVEVADDNDEVELCVGCEDDEDENTENLDSLSGAGASKVLPLGLLQSTFPFESFPQHRHRPVVELYTTSGCGWSPTIRGQSWLVFDHCAFFSEIRTSTVGGTYCRPWSIRRHLSVFDPCNLRHSNLTCLSPAERGNGRYCWRDIHRS